MEKDSPNQYFLALVQQHELIGMLGLGKLADPTTGEAEPDLEKTAFAIGILEMLEGKTRGNLAELEHQQLRRVLTTLRLNYVEEVKKGKPEAQAETEPTAGPETGTEAESEAKPKAKPKVEPEAKPKAEPKAKPEAKPESDELQKDGQQEDRESGQA